MGKKDAARPSPSEREQSGAVAEASRPDGLQVVSMSNSFVEARYEYSEVQLDILFYLMACLRLDKEDRPVLSYELDVAELENLRQSKLHTSRLQKIIEDMGNKPISLLTDDMADADDFASAWLFQSVKYIKGRKMLSVKLSEPIIPYLFDLRREFTSVQLQSILMMTSKYAKRIYQICSQWKHSNIGESRVYELSALRSMIGLNDADYTMLSALRKFVLDVSVKQINEYSDLKVRYELIKTGRAFTRIKFIVQVKAAPQIPIDYRHNDKQTRAKAHLAALGITDEKLVATILNNHLEEFYKWNHGYQTGKFKVKTSPSGHLLRSLGMA